MRTFSRPLTEKRRLPRKPTYQASKQAASQGRCVNGLTPTGDGNIIVYNQKRLYLVLMALPQQGTETQIQFSFMYFCLQFVLMALPQQGTETFIVVSSFGNGSL